MTKKKLEVTDPLEYKFLLLDYLLNRDDKIDVINTILQAEQIQNPYIRNIPIYAQSMCNKSVTDTDTHVHIWW